MSTDESLAIRAAMEPYYNKIAALTTAEQIRAFLAAEGIRSPRYSFSRGMTCPIATYISRGCDHTVYVRNYEITAAYVEDKQYTNFSNTPAMREFIRRFDNSEYPELWTS